MKIGVGFESRSMLSVFFRLLTSYCSSVQVRWSVHDYVLPSYVSELPHCKQVALGSAV